MNEITTEAPVEKDNVHDGCNGQAKAWKKVKEKWHKALVDNNPPSHPTQRRNSENYESSWNGKKNKFKNLGIVKIK